MTTWREIIYQRKRYRVKWAGAREFSLSIAKTLIVVDRQARLFIYSRFSALLSAASQRVL